jgi:hypothetical protein
MLDTQIRILSPDPPGPPIASPILSYDDLVQFLNQLNAAWVQATKRISPQLLIEFLSITGPRLSTHVASLDPDAPARHPVAWAGDEVSPNWFNIGRNYTEYWHHQQQIRDAVNAAALTTREWLYPVLALFVRAIPRAYRDIQGREGQTVNIVITGEAGGAWSIAHDSAHWTLFEGPAPAPAAAVTLSGDTAWRLFTKALDREAAQNRIQTEGAPELTAPFLNVLAVMA